MRTYDLILKKRNGLSLAQDEISYLIDGYVQGVIPDYQISALAMAIYFQGMDKIEVLSLTEAMVDSGERIDLSAIPGCKVDKHSTGGVGDTTTLILAPMVAAAGVPVAKLSGRGLGHTGGTLDKLESIPGFSSTLAIPDLIEAVKKYGIAVAGQSGNLVPADKLLYALRDVTATVDSIPLIASSIMSKKIAAGADALVLDVKSGAGAFLKKKEDAYTLARTMVEIGKGAGRKTVALVTAMDQPLGMAVGNALEVEEAILTLQGEGPKDLEELCLSIGSWMLVLAMRAADPAEGEELLRQTINSGSALLKFRELMISQGGDSRVIDNPSLLPQPDLTVDLRAEQEGYIAELEAEAVGVAAMTLGAGRETKEAVIDPAVGIKIVKKIGDPVSRGDRLATFYLRNNHDLQTIEAVKKQLHDAYRIQASAVEKPPLIYGVVE